MAYLRSRGRSCSRTVAMGIDPLKSQTSGDCNIAMGVYAADAITTGKNIIAIKSCDPVIVVLFDGNWSFNVIR